MKISIISTNRFRRPMPVLPIGPAIVAGTLRADGHDVRLLDLGQEEEPEHAIASHLAAFQPDLVGVGLRNLENNMLVGQQSFMPEIKRYVQAVRNASSSPIVLGGPGYSLYPGEILELLEVPYGLAGEAEDSVAALVDRIEEGVPPDGVPGACYLLRGKAKVSEAAKVRTFSGVAGPAYDLVDCGKYLAEGAAIPVESRRGCHLACSYCPESADPEGARLKPPEVAVAEIERIVAQLGTDKLFFTDGVFQYPPDHALAVCREMARADLGVQWQTGINPLGLSRDLIEAMKEAGCSGVGLGIEAATDEMLNSYRKGYTQEDIVRALDDLRAAGLPFVSFLLFGGPGETEESVWRALDFLHEAAPGAPVVINVGLRVFPGTALEDMARREGRIAPGRSMLEPTYYLSEGLDESIVDRLDDYCQDRPAWVTWPALERRAQQEAQGATS